MSGETVTLSGAAVVHTLPSVSVLVLDLLAEGKYNNTQSIMVTFGPFQSLKRRVIIHLVHEQQLPIIKNKIMFPFNFYCCAPPVHYRVNTVLGGGRLGNM